MILSNVLRQHIDEGAGLYETRSTLTGAAGIGLWDLRRLDERIAAHLDGVSMVSQDEWLRCADTSEPLSAGGLFVAAARSIADKNVGSLNALLAVSGTGTFMRGLIGAFGWVERAQLQGIVTDLLASTDPLRRMVGITTCSMHRVDPGLTSARRLLDASPFVRARALRTAGEIGCDEAVPACASAISADDPECRFWAAWSSVLLGNRGPALEMLTSTALTPHPHRLRVFRLTLQALSAGAGHEVLQQLAEDPGQRRELIQGSGIVGDSKYVPWLIGHMADEKTARLAGEAFTLITGVDLGHNNLWGNKPENVESGPNDDPDDPNVDMDPDEGLPWPDPKKIETWWAANASRFQPGPRYFMGAPVTREHCIDVLRNGYQRQRILAAHYLCLLDPGTPLFNTSAPAWRQQRLLAKMG